MLGECSKCGSKYKCEGGSEAISYGSENSLKVCLNRSNKCDTLNYTDCNFVGGREYNGIIEKYVDQESDCPAGTNANRTGKIFNTSQFEGNDLHDLECFYCTIKPVYTATASTDGYFLYLTIKDEVADATGATYGMDRTFSATITYKSLSIGEPEKMETCGTQQMKKCSDMYLGAYCNGGCDGTGIRKTTGFCADYWNATASTVSAQTTIEKYHTSSDNTNVGHPENSYRCIYGVNATFGSEISQYWWSDYSYLDRLGIPHD